MTDNLYLNAINHWLEKTVIGLNLCPFAKREFLEKRIRITVSDDITTQQLLQTLQKELTQLDNKPKIETILIVHPKVLQNFGDYNDFLNEVDALLIRQDYIGTYQVASFHPNYQFADTQSEDPENYTNRSPFPLIHLLREKSIEQALTSYPNPEKIPERNIALMNKIGSKTLQERLKSCFKD